MSRHCDCEAEDSIGNGSALHQQADSWSGSHACPFPVQFKRQTCYLERSAVSENIPILSLLSLAKVTQLKATLHYTGFPLLIRTQQHKEQKNESPPNKERQSNVVSNELVSCRFS